MNVQSSIQLPLLIWDMLDVHTYTYTINGL